MDAKFKRGDRVWVKHPQNFWEMSQGMIEREESERIHCYGVSFPDFNIPSLAYSGDEIESANQVTN